MLSNWVMKVECIKDVAISLVVRAALLYKWRKEYYQQGAEVFPRVGKSTGIINAEKIELNRLSKENRRLKMERDILKKSVSIFSKNNWRDIISLRIIEIILQLKRYVK